MTATKTAKPKSGTRSRAAETLSDDELAALKETVLERKTAAKRGANADGEADVMAKLAELPKADRLMGERIHAIVKAAAPDLESRTWYGMPAYTKDGKVVCFFQSAQKFDSRYATFGFSDQANLDEGAVWPTSFAVKELTAADEARLGALVKKAVS